MWKEYQKAGRERGARKKTTCRHNGWKLTKSNGKH